MDLSYSPLITDLILEFTWQLLAHKDFVADNKDAPDGVVGEEVLEEEFAPRRHHFRRIFLQLLPG
jgi:hypothetical protein